MSKKKPKKNVKRLYKSQPHLVKKINQLVYRKITVKWLPNTDEYQAYIDIVLNGTRLLMLGTIDPDTSYFDGIRVTCKKPMPWMTANEVQLARTDAPNFFNCLLAYYHTVGDLLDSGEAVKSIPTASAFNSGKLFNDTQLLDIFKIDK